jgi:isopenicillin-N epimerase
MTHADRRAHALPATSPLAQHWRLSPETVYLNHGSFGAVPIAVQAEQDRLRALMEADSVRFFVQRLDGLLDDSRAALADFLNCSLADLVFVPNATVAVATILHNLDAEGYLSPGDEILVSEHEYPACMNALRSYAKKWGASIVTAPIPFPASSSDELAESILSRIGPRTKLAMLSEVTSSSGLILPIRTLTAALEGRGVRVLVDAAHSPGFAVGLNLEARPGEIRPSYYTANCHKWLCAPKGTGLLFVREDRRTALMQRGLGGGGFRPLALSNWAEKPKPGRSDFHKEFDYVGTQDFTNWCALASAIATLPSLIGARGYDGWNQVMKRNHELCLRGRDLICRTIGVAPPVPDFLLGSMATILLPTRPADVAAKLAARPSAFHDALQDALLDRHNLQVPVWSVASTDGWWPLPGGLKGRRVLRISAQLYNTIEQYEYLAECLQEELRAE